MAQTSVWDARCHFLASHFLFSIQDDHLTASVARFTGS
jgi:hypothetical protein